MTKLPPAPWRKRLPVSSRIFAAAAALSMGYSIYLDQGIAWVGILSVVSVVVILLVKRHQRHQDEQYARFFVKRPTGIAPPTRHSGLPDN